MRGEISPVCGPPGSQWQFWAPSRTTRRSATARIAVSTIAGGHTITMGDAQRSRASSRRRCWTRAKSAMASPGPGYIFQLARTNEMRASTGTPSDPVEAENPNP
jgi:hypothetical protein